MDYIFDGSAQQPVFPAGSTVTNGDSACIEIPIVDDEDGEGDEQFQLEIVGAYPGIIVSPSFTTVFISDDAGIYTAQANNSYSIG